VSVVIGGTKLEIHDQDLIMDILSGSIEKYDILMKRYQELVYKISFSFGKNRENAMDISQEVFLKAYQKLGHIRDKSRFKPWITKLAYREAINWTRSHKHQENQSDFDEQQHTIITAQDEELAKEHKKQLIRCLFELNTRYRLAVVLRYFENQSIREIAETMQCSESMVKNLLYRSICKMKHSLTRNPERSIQSETM
jgi:RNA polymerase sigma-70 factor (ECF subfamily)